VVVSGGSGPKPPRVEPGCEIASRSRGRRRGATSLRASALLGLAGLAWSEGDYDAAATAAARRPKACSGRPTTTPVADGAWNTIGVIEHGRGDVAACGGGVRPEHRAVPNPPAS
jgi:hypothetical protein